MDLRLTREADADLGFRERRKAGLAERNADAARPACGTDTCLACRPRSLRLGVGRYGWGSRYGAEGGRAPAGQGSGKIGPLDSANAALPTFLRQTHSDRGVTAGLGRSRLQLQGGIILRCHVVEP